LKTHVVALHCSGSPPQCDCYRRAAIWVSCSSSAHAEDLRFGCLWCQGRSAGTSSRCIYTNSFTFPLKFTWFSWIFSCGW